MMLNLITLANVKIQLGLPAGTTLYDTNITNMIPFVSSDVRRILNAPYHTYTPATFTSGSRSIYFGDSSWPSFQNQYPIKYDLGQVVYAPGIPADTYLYSYDPTTGNYTLSDTPTASGTFIYPTVRISMFPAIAKMIWYRIQGMSVDDVSKKDVQSESYGPVSVTYSQREINAQYNYPQVLIDDLGLPYAKVG